MSIWFRYRHTQRNELQSNLAIRNFLVALKLFLNAKSSLSIWSKWQIGPGNGSLIPTCSLSNRSLLQSLTVSLFLQTLFWCHDVSSKTIAFIAGKTNFICFSKKYWYWYIFWAWFRWVLGLECAENEAFVPHPSSFMLKSEMIFYSLRHSKSRREGYLIGLIAMNRA